MKFKMNHIAMAAAIGLGCHTFAVAQTSQVKTAGNWEFYGRAHLSVDQLDNGAVYDRTNVSSNSSRLGFRGDKQFGSLRGFWQIESEVMFSKTSDSSATQDDKNRLATRDTFAGIEGRFGNVRFGKFDTPMKAAREAANLFGDQLGDMRNITRAGARFDERPNNLIQYQSPAMNGFRLALAYAPHEGTTAVTDAATGVETKNAMTSGSLTYTGTDLVAALAFEDYEKNASAGDRKATRLAVSYRVIPSLRLVGFYQDAKAVVSGVNEGSKVTGFGAEYQLVPNEYVLRAHMFDRKADKANADSTLYAVGVESIISRELRLYANYGTVDNDASARVVPWAEGRTANAAGANGKTARGFSVGMIYNF